MGCRGEGRWGAGVRGDGVQGRGVKGRDASRSTHLVQVHLSFHYKQLCRRNSTQGLFEVWSWSRLLAHLESHHIYPPET